MRGMWQASQKSRKDPAATPVPTRASVCTFSAVAGSTWYLSSGPAFVAPGAGAVAVPASAPVVMSDAVASVVGLAEEVEDDALDEPERMQKSELSLATQGVQR